MKSLASILAKGGSRLSILVVVDKVEAVKKAVRDATKYQVMVGIPEGDNARAGEQIGNAALGYIFENGAPEANIPAREWLKPGVKAAEPRTIPKLKAAAEAAIAGNAGVMLQKLHEAGIIAVSTVKARIVEGIPPALKPSTLAARRRRGVTRTTPLIDTSAWLGAITYVVRKR